MGDKSGPMTGYTGTHPRAPLSGSPSALQNDTLLIVKFKEILLQKYLVLMYG